MIKILVVTPYPGLKQLCHQLAEEQEDLDITVQEADLHEAVPIVKQGEREGYHVIISRGGTAKVIRQHTSLPVIDIKLSGYDIMRTLMLVKDNKIPVEIIGFPNICKGAAEVSNLMGFQIPHTMIDDRDKVEKAVIQAKQRGVHLVIGDTVTVRIAESHGLQGMLITSGRESVLDAFEQARNMTRSLMDVQRHLTAYHQWKHRLREGVLFVDQDGRVVESNKACEHMLGMPSTYLSRPLATCFPELEDHFQQLKAEKQIAVTVMLNNRLYDVEGSIFFQNGSESVYELRFLPGHNRTIATDTDLIISPIKSMITSFSQWIALDEALQDVIDRCRQWAVNNEPICLVGERGTGKKSLASIIHHAGSQNNERLIEAGILYGSERVLDELKHLFVDIQGGTVYVWGVEQLSFDQQVAVWEQSQQLQGRVIFGFLAPLEKLVASEKLSPAFYDEVKERVVFLPVLRERKESFDAYIRTFIAQSNAKYGKQIVGVHDNVAAYLLKQPWPGNLQQLKEVIERCVQKATGPYIDQGIFNHSDVLMMLNDTMHSNGVYVPDDAADMYLVHLDQTLTEMEHRIIEHVLHLENYNQTKVASRLGINRSTLWRKLKSLESQKVDNK